MGESLCPRHKLADRLRVPKIEKIGIGGPMDGKELEI
jgi:hypothetical protein